MSQYYFNGKTTLITRPYHQAQPLAAAIKECGGESIILPMLEIIPLTPNLTPLKPITANKIAIFTSANVVNALNPSHHSFFNRSSSLFDWFDQNLLAKNKIHTIAIGEGTAAALASCGIPVHGVPAQHCTEGLLALPMLQNIQAQKIMIFCGENPRPLLKKTLSERGAKVEEYFCYRRVKIQYSATELALALQTAHNIVCTSQESLSHLLSQLTSEMILCLQKRRLITISVGMQNYAKQFNLNSILAVGASAKAILEVL